MTVSFGNCPSVTNVTLTRNRVWCRPWWRWLVQATNWPGTVATNICSIAFRCRLTLAGWRGIVWCIRNEGDERTTRLRYENAQSARHWLTHRHRSYLYMYRRYSHDMYYHVVGKQQAQHGWRMSMDTKQKNNSERFTDRVISHGLVHITNIQHLPC